MKRKIIYILLFLTSLFMVQCANMVTPTGGPKDVTPPKVVKAVPENGNLGFFGRKIEITFDEYVTLSNANQEVIVSPPPTVKPDIKLSNKTVVVKFKEALRPDATYTIHFGEAIKDLHEGNVFKDYVYSFSTGNQIDTLTLAGKIVNADDEKPADGMFVTLYDGEADSLFFQPLRHGPDFITKTDKDGVFHFDGLPNKRFLLFALSDVNNNLYFDMPNEKVAFLDTLVSPLDTAHLMLRAFTEVDTSQMLLEKKLVEEGLLRFVFRHPADRVSFTFSDPWVEAFRMVKVWSADKDTLSCYFTPNVMDSLWVVIHYDTLINDSTHYSLKYRETQQQKKNGPDFMKVTSNLRGKLLLPDEDFTLHFPEPVMEVRPYDSLGFERVDEYGMRYRVMLEVADTVEYAVNLPDSLFFSVRGRTNDSLSFQVKRAKDTDYGNLFVSVAPPRGTQVVVQLLDARNQVVDHRVFDTLQRVEFLRLAPAKYKLRAILDTDRNGRWSTGNFHLRFLPETIVPFKDDLDVKAGWDIDLDEVWNLSF